MKNHSIIGFCVRIYLHFAGYKMRISSSQYFCAVPYTCTCLPDIAQYRGSEKNAIPFVIFIRSSEIKL